MVTALLCKYRTASFKGCIAGMNHTIFNQMLSDRIYEASSPLL